VKRDLAEIAQTDAQAESGGSADVGVAAFRVPVDVRSISLVVIAVMLCVFAMQWAHAIIIPILLGLMLSYALTPATDWLERMRVRRSLAAGAILMAIVGAIGAGVWSLSDQATTLVSSLPEVAQRLRQLAQGSHPSGTALDKVQQAALEIEKVTESAAASATQAASNAASAAGGTRASRTTRPLAETRVVIDGPHLNIKEYLWSGTLGALTFMGQVTIVLFVAFFLLASGDGFRRKLVHLAGPKLTQKKVTLEVLDEISSQIQRYLLVQGALSVVVGIGTGLAFWAMGLDQAGAWGMFAGVMNLIPYFGAIVTSAGAAVVAAVQLGSVDVGLLAGATSFGIHTVVGNLLAPIWLGRASRISPLAVFISVLAFGWLWGVCGLLLGVPILMVVKSICDRVDDLKPIGELMSV
jgi:predicted PurR-regulated permease PerM